MPRVRITTVCLTLGQSATAQQPFSGASHPAPSQYTPPVSVGVQHHTAQAYSAPILKKCAAEYCSRDVHYDHELGPFDYCSPECRDRHLLPLEQERLKRDIEKNKEKMTVYLPTTTASSSITGASATDDGKKSEYNTSIYNSMYVPLYIRENARHF